MNIHYFLRRIVWGAAVLLNLGLNSCQRADYSFQATPHATVAQAASVTIVAVSEVVTDAPGAGVTMTSAKRPTRLGSRPKNSQNYSVRSVVQATIARPAQFLNLRVRKSFAPQRAVAALVRKASEPTPKHVSSKGIAVLLALLLGMFGAHLFYLRYSRRALNYLIPTLLCIGLMLIAISIANSAVFGSGIGGAFVGVFLLAMGAGGIALTYLKALLDGVRILTGSLT